MAIEPVTLDTLVAALRGDHKAPTSRSYVPVPPDPQQLFMGTQVLVEDWFDDFESYVYATHHGKIPDRQWFSFLRQLCQDHPGLKSLLDRLRSYDRSKLRRIKRAIERELFPGGQPQAENYAQTRYSKGIDMPSGDDPLAVLAVHRKLLQAFHGGQRPNDDQQVQTFLQAISPQFRTMLAPQRLHDLGEIEEILRRYYSQVGTTSDPSKVSFQPSPIYAAMGGGDPTRNPTDLKAVLHQLRIDMRNDIKEAIKATTAPQRTGVMNVDIGAPAKSGRPRDHTPEGRRGRYGERVRSDPEEESDSGEERAPKRVRWADKAADRKRDYQGARRHCRFCRKAGRRSYDTHDSAQCFSHPDPKIARSNRDRMAFNWPWKNKGGSDRSDGREQPKQPNLNEADPAVRAFVDQKVKERLDDMRRMAKNLDMLKAGEPEE
jgi:hypothetical protein